MNKGNGKIIFCCNVPFPNGNAGAVRVFYVVKALLEAGRDVLVIAHGNGDDNGDSQVKEYRGIRYTTYDESRKAVFRFLNTRILGGVHCVRKLRRQNLSSDDIVYIYANNSSFVYPVYAYCRKRNIKQFIDVVEWHQAHQYGGGVCNRIRFKLLDYTFTTLSPKIHNIVAISTCIEQHFKKQSCNVMIIPPLTEEKKAVAKAEGKWAEGNVNIIYPGIPFEKDDISIMLHAIKALPKDILDNVRFHLTGITENVLRNYLKDKAPILDELKANGNLVIHGVLSYKVLENLYENMDFLLLSRYEDLVNEANFPSKIPELMTRGIIPIGNKVGDYYTYLKNGEDSFLFDKNNVEECRDAIVSAIMTTRGGIDAFKERARKCAMEHFDFSMWSQRISDFLK